MTAPTCHTCGGTFTLGETVNASDWTVIDETGCHGEVRYEHLTCAPNIPAANPIGASA